MKIRMHKKKKSMADKFAELVEEIKRRQEKVPKNFRRYEAIVVDKEAVRHPSRWSLILP